jgi:hypothetical protein
VIADSIDLPGGRPIGANDKQCDEDNEYEARHEAGNEEEQVGHVPPRPMEQPGEPPLWFLECEQFSLRQYEVKTLHQDEDGEAPVSTHSDEQRSQPCEAMSMSFAGGVWLRAPASNIRSGVARQTAVQTPALVNARDYRRAVA